MHGGRLSEDEPMADMNLIPLIDIALTLLIILMVTTVFVKKPGVNLNLPKTVTREGAPETDKDLTIAVSAVGDLYIDGLKQADSAVQVRLIAAAAKDKDARVMVKGDRTVPYARVMDVMDMARQAGLTRITLPTEPKTLQDLSAPTTAPPGPPPAAPSGAQTAPPGQKQVHTAGMHQR